MVYSAGGKKKYIYMFGMLHLFHQYRLIGSWNLYQFILTSGKIRIDKMRRNTIAK